MKRVLSLLLIISMVLAIIIPVVGSAQGQNNGEDTTEFVPLIEIVESKIPNVSAGEEFDLEFTIQNSEHKLESFNAYDITITPQLEENSPFEFVNFGADQYIDRLLSGEDTTLSFRLKANTDAELKTYPITINYSFSNSYNDKYQESAVIYVKVNKKNQDVDLVIESIKTNKDVYAEDSFYLSFNLINRGQMEPKDVEVSLSGLSESTIINKGLTKKSYKTLGIDKYEKILFYLQATDNVEKGYYPLDVNIQYKDNDNVTYNIQEQLFVKINELKAANILIDNIQFPNEKINRGEDFTLTFDIKNEGEQSARNLVISLDAGDEIIPKSQSIKSIVQLPPNEQRKLTFEFESSSYIDAGSYPIQINLEYYDKEDDYQSKKTIIQPISVYIYKNQVSKPRILIDKYSIGGSSINAGESFDLNLSVLNTSSENTIKNVKMSFSVNGTDSSVITPVDRANSIFISQIQPNASANRNIKMNVSPSAEVQVYDINVNFEYEDEEGNEYSDNETVAVNVNQIANIDISDVEMSTNTINSKAIVTLTADFFNTGKVNVTNLMVDIDGNFKPTNGQYYVGDFDTGKSDTYDVQMVPESESVEGELIFTFDTPNGEKREIRKEFLISSKENAVSKIGGFNRNESNSNLSGDAKPAMANQMNDRNINKVNSDAQSSIVEKIFSDKKNIIYLGAALVTILIVFSIVRKKQRGMNADA